MAKAWLVTRAKTKEGLQPMRFPVARRGLVVRGMMAAFCSLLVGALSPARTSEQQAFTDQGLLEPVVTEVTAQEFHDGMRYKVDPENPEPPTDGWSEELDENGNVLSRTRLY